MPAKTFAHRVNSQCFGGVTAKEFDTRPFEELQQEEWVSGLELLEGGNGIIKVRGADLYRTRKELQDKLETIPVAMTKEDITLKDLKYDYDEKTGKFVSTSSSLFCCLK